jgi:AcrR family transcriptional regulator
MIMSRRRADGERSRAAILDAAAPLASVEGLEGLSIGSLASRLGMSKSGLFAHFGSKQALQLAVVDAAARVFEREVIAVATAAPDGVARIVALAEAYLSYVERRVFPGGSFFEAAASDHEALSEPVRAAVSAGVDSFLARLASAAERARDEGELGASTDPDQVAFEVFALLIAANARFLLTARADSLARARSGVESVLFRAASA